MTCQVKVYGGRGASNYELWLAAGNVGTVQQFLDQQNATAQAARDAAIAARNASEAAAGVAQAASLTAPLVYTTTSAGLAAVPEGGTFWVSTGNVLSLYRDVSGAAALLGTMAVNNRFPLGVFGTETTRVIPTNLNGSDVPADIGQIYIGNVVASADAITIDAGQPFPGGVAFRRYRGSPSSPTRVMAGDQLGYLDFRGLSGLGTSRRFINAASIDVLVDSSVPFGDGDAPPTHMRFSITRDNNQAQEAVRILPVGSDGFGLWVNYERPGSDEVDGPDGSAAPSLYVVSRGNDWTADIYAKPSTGFGYALRVNTLGASASDYLIAGLAGPHGSKTVQFDVRGNGEVNTVGHYKVGGTKVVGARGAALPADATDLPTALTLVNAIKARMIAHGLVFA